MATQYVDIIGEGFVQGVPGTFANCRVYYDGSQILHIGALYVDWPTPPPPARTGASVTVTAFGAAGNATADDTLPIQNALNAVAAIGSGAVLVPPGNYLISSPLIIDNDNIALVGMGQRGSAPTIQIASSADPTWALIVGNTKYVNNCFVDGLAFAGRANNTSTGGGILFRSNGGSVKQTQVAQFGGQGIKLSAFSGTIFELLLDDVDLVQNGRNTITPADNLYVDGNVSDCEYMRLITAGDSGKSTTRYGIYLNASSNHKFVNCHAYFCNLGGLTAQGTDLLQVIGGEWENNGSNGGMYLEGTTRSMITNAAFFGNTGSDLIISDCVGVSLTNSTSESTVPARNIGIFNSTSVLIRGVNIPAPTAAIGVALDSNCSKCVLSDSSINATTALSIAAQNCCIHDNQFVAGAITEVTGANNNNFHDNQFLTSQVPTKVGTATKFKNNVGYNPIGQVTAPAFPATTVAATNTTGVDVTAFVANGTSAITQTQIAGQNGTYNNTNFQIAANGWGAIRIPAGGSVKFTYGGGTPTWVWMGD